MRVRGAVRKDLIVIKDRIIKVLSYIRPGVEWEAAAAIVDDGLLDSFDMISFVAELDNEFRVRIGLEHLEPENFNSVEAIAALLVSLGANP